MIQPYSGHCCSIYVVLCVFVVNVRLPTTPTVQQHWNVDAIFTAAMLSTVQRYQNGEMAAGSDSVEDREQFLAALRSSIEIFVNRMRSNSQRGRSIANDSSVQTLFMTLTAMHPQLLQYIQQQEDQRGTFSHFSSVSSPPSVGLICITPHLSVCLSFYPVSVPFTELADTALCQCAI